MPASASRKWWALGLICLVQFMTILDVAIVNVALPSIQVDLGFTQENLQWVISAYALMFGGFLLLGGRLGDRLGRRRMFFAGIALFTAASLFAGLSWSEESLIAARALQGLGAALVSPSALAIVTATFAEGRERNIALGVWGATGGFGAAAGVLLGGILTDLSELGVDLLRERPRRHYRAHLHAALGPRESRSPHEDVRPPRGSAHHLGARRARARNHAGEQLGLGIGDDVDRLRDLGCAPPRVSRVGAGTRGAARADVDLPGQDGARREHHRLHHGHDPLLDVPAPDAVHAAGASHDASEDGPRLPRRRRNRDPLGERRGHALQSVRRQAHPPGGNVVPLRGARLVHADLDPTVRTGPTCSPGSS